MHLILLATLVLAVTAVPLTNRVRFQQHQKVFDYQVPFYNEGLQEGRDSLKDNIIQGIFGGNQQGSLEEGGYSQDNFHFQKKEFERYLNGRDFERLRDSHVLGRFFSSDSLQKYYPSENFVQFFRDPNFVRSYDFQSEYFVDYVTSPELRKYVELPEFQEFLQHPLFRHYYTSDYFWQHVGNSHFNEHYQDHELRQYFQDFFNQVLPVLNLQGGDFVQRDSVSEHHEQYLRYFILYVLHDPYFYYHVHHYGRQHPVYQQYFENVDHLDEVFQWFHDHVGTPSVGYSEVQERNQLVDQQRGYEYNTDTYGDDSTQGKGDYFQNTYGQDTINTQEESGRLYISPVVRRYLQTHSYLRSYILKGYLPSHIRSQIFSDLQGKVRPYLLQVFRNSYLPQHVREVILRTVYNQRQGGEQYQHDSNTPDYGYNTDTYGDGYTQGRDDYFKNTYDQDTISTQEESGRLYISPVVRRYLQTHPYLKSYILKGYLPSHIRSQIFSDLQGKVKPYLLQVFRNSYLPQHVREVILRTVYNQRQGGEQYQYDSNTPDYGYNTYTYGDDSTQGRGDYFQNTYDQDTINTQEESGRLYISPVVRRYLQTHPYLRSYILKGYLPSHIRSQIFSDLQGKVRPYLLQVFRNSYLPQHVREVILRTVYNQRQGGEQYQYDSNTPDYGYNTDTYGDDSTQGKGDYFQNTYDQDTINTQEESGRLYISQVLRRYLQTHPYLRSYILKGYLPSHIRNQIFSDLQGKVRPYLLQVFRNSYLPQHVREVILRTVYNQRQGGEQYQYDSNTPYYGYNTDTYGDGSTQGRSDYFQNTYDQNTINTQEELGRFYLSPVLRRYLQTHPYLRNYILKGYLPSHIRNQIFSDLQGKVRPYLLQVFRNSYLPQHVREGILRTVYNQRQGGEQYQYDNNTQYYGYNTDKYGDDYSNDYGRYGQGNNNNNVQTYGRYYKYDNTRRQ